MHIIVLFNRLEKFSGLGTLFIGQGWEVLGDVADFTGYNVPTI